MVEDKCGVLRCELALKQIEMSPHDSDCCLADSGFTLAMYHHN